MSQAGAQVASDQFSPPYVRNGSKPSKNLSGHLRKGSKPINSRKAFIRAIAVPVLFVMTASSNLEKQPLITLTCSEPPPRRFHSRQCSTAFNETAVARFRFPHRDRATTVPPAGGTDNQVKSTHGTLGARFVKPHCGK